MLGKIHQRYSVIPPIKLARELAIDIPPILWDLDFVIPLQQLHTNLQNRLKRAKLRSRENSKDFNA